MWRIADRATLQVRVEELVADAELVLVEERDGRLVERRRCVIEAADITVVKVRFGDGADQDFSVDTLTTKRHSYYYVPAERWDSQFRIAA